MRNRVALLVAALLSGILLAMAWLRPSPQAYTAAGLPPSPCARVVVNEVAWGGTRAHATDEWIELANTTPLTIELAGWQLRAADGSPHITLSGQIGPYGFYLIERTADTTVADIPADLVCPFGAGLSNGGEQLELRDPLGRLVDTVNAGGTAWPNSAGLSFPYPSMERIAPGAPDKAASWVSNDGLLTNGTDAGGNPILGTPRSPNSAYIQRRKDQVDLVAALNGPEIAGPDRVVSYTLELRNAGGVIAVATRMTLTLPTVLSFSAQESSYPYTLAGQQVIWTVGDLAPDATGGITPIVVSARVHALAAAPFTTTLHATSALPDLDPCNNSMAWETLPGTSASGLRVSKWGPEVLTTTGLLTYTIEVANRSEGVLAHAHLIDVLPADARFLTQISSFPVIATPPTLTWSLGELAPQATHLLTVIAEITRPLAGLAGLVNTATGSATGPGNLPLSDTARWTTRIGTPQVVIAELLYDGYQYLDADEAIRLANIGTAPEALDGWELCKAVASNLTCVDIPPLTLAPGERVWVARNAGAFRASFGFFPDVVLPKWLAFTNTGGAILLRAPGNRFVDTLVYKGGEPAVPGWTGPSLLPYLNRVAPERGQILARRLDERTGLPAVDTNSASDWIQHPGDPALGRRVLYPGWELDTLFHPLIVTETATIIVGIAPDNAYEALAQTLLGAQRTISIEVYSLRHLDLVDILAAKARDGVQVTVLLEGSPVGVGVLSPSWQTQLYACREIERAGGACWFMAHHPQDAIFNRYAYLHAKLVIVDDTWMVTGSQNLTPGGMPADDKRNGTTGSRGVMLITDAPTVVRHAATIFALDMNPTRHSDLVPWNTRYLDRYGEPLMELVDFTPIDGIDYTVRFAEPATFTGSFGFELFTAPEAALRQSDALLGLVRRAGAGDVVYVQQLYEYAAWGNDVDADPNLRLQAYVQAARRGARVRILLNARSFATDDPRPPAENMLTLQTVNDLAVREALDLRVALGDPTKDGLHNKMVLVKLGGNEGYVHVGSLNGSEGAGKLNRELVLQVRSLPLTTYLERLFIHDWSLSNPILLPVVMRQYTPPPPPANYLVISEVEYTPTNSAAEWVELYNPTGKAIDLRDYKVGDAESPDAYEPMFRFPPGASVAAGGTVLIAVNAVNVPGADFEFYPSDPAVPTMEVYTAWGNAAYPFHLRNEGDHVVLLDGADRVIDVVVWGDKTFPGTHPHPGVLVKGASLERYPAARDTDDCAVDFRERYPPTPGRISE
jgi:phosphatidylserine/phosphatidylglycerophosphate/cardiolipin synthase-like enzyme